MIATIEATLIKYIWWVVAIALVVIGIVGWLGYNSWRNSQNTQAVITAQKNINTGNIKGGQAAVNTTQNNQDKNNATDAKTATVVNNFNSYPAAKIAIDPALFDAFNQSICMYRSASNLLQCRAMQQADPTKVEGSGN